MGYAEAPDTNRSAVLQSFLVVTPGGGQSRVIEFTCCRFVGQGDEGFLLADAFLELHQPLADAIGMFAGIHHGGFGTLNQHDAQMSVTAFGDVPKSCLAASRILPAR